MPIHALPGSWLRRRKKLSPSSLQDYRETFEKTLHTLLDLLDDAPDTRSFARLKAVPLDLPAWLDRDVAPGYAPQGYHADMAPFVATVHHIRSQAVWAGYQDLLTIQPALCGRMAARAWKAAMPEALMIPGDVQPLVIGPASIRALLWLNNVLCWHHRIRSSRMARAPLTGRFFLRRAISRSALRHTIDTGSERLLEDRTRQGVGDLFFLHSLTGYVRQLTGDNRLAPYLRTLIRCSAWTNLSRIADDDLWERMSTGDLKDAARLIEDRGTFCLAGAMVQQWVDALLHSPEDRQGPVFGRIGAVLTGFLEPDDAGDNPPETLSIPVPSGVRTLLWFVRTLVRSWPDEKAQEEAFGVGRPQGPLRTDFWHGVFSTVSGWLDEARNKITADEWAACLPLPDERAFQAILMMTRRKSTDVL